MSNFQTVNGVDDEQNIDPDTWMSGDDEDLELLDENEERQALGFDFEEEDEDAGDELDVLEEEELSLNGLDEAADELEEI